ncbi:uncharacterized protein V1516DRAFT_636444 [Lipomyces oligophaga]|uniref:uncharacterized protein n=1 Tax=Lipomyces oligophaga TaxID=45792 RepID=UPI0034CFA971
MLTLSRSSTPFVHSLARRSCVCSPGKISLRSTRSFTTSSASTSASTSAQYPIHPAICTLLDRLDHLAPAFPLEEDQIEILNSPSDFYSTLKSKILSAKSLIFLASLYIGRTEHDLVNTLRTALRQNPFLQVQLLTDALRGTRESPDPSSASLLASLVAEFPDRVHVRLFHTPNLRGISKAVLPSRINEGWGLQHMKLYGFDSEIILSGANLSEDYFTNRQDRYYLFRSSAVTDYYRSIFNAISSLSYVLLPDTSSPAKYTLSWPESNPGPEPTKRAHAFVRAATKIISPLLHSPISQQSSLERLCVGSTKTIFYPISQFTPLLDPNTSTEAPAITELLSILKSPDKFSWTFTAGYFNLHPEYRSRLLESQTSRGLIITAAPEANGFYQSSGISKHLPPAYLLLAKRFVQDVAKAHKSKFIHLLEWQNGVLNQPGGWTYHAKGIWLATPKQTLPCITVIGSSNFTRRSHTMDLESNGLIVTTDKTLQQKLADEVDNLLQHTREMRLEDFNAENRRVSFGVKAALSMLGLFL